jgi:uncharacterized protein YxjI
MEIFEVSQVVMTIGSTYLVRLQPSEDVVMTVKGSLMSSTPKFSLMQGADGGPELASLVGNFIKTKYQILDAEKKPLGNLLFPAIAFKKTLVLTVNGRGYTADGGLMGGSFKCVDNEDQVALEISNKSRFVDRFEINIKGAIPKEVGLLAAVAIHSRFFEFV